MLRKKRRILTKGQRHCLRRSAGSRVTIKAVRWVTTIQHGGNVDQPDTFQADRIAEFDAFAFGCSAQGDEVLEEDEFEPMFAGCAEKLSGKPVALFGSYGWGDGQWMRDWEARCADAGIHLCANSVICNETPDADAAEACKALGAFLAKA